MLIDFFPLQLTAQEMNNDSARIERALGRIEIIDHAVSSLENYLSITNASLDQQQNTLARILRASTQEAAHSASKERDHHNVFLQDYATVYTQWRPAPL